MALVEIRGVSCEYGDVLAVDDVSLDIGENEFFALLGPSGCGKTTLLRSLAGLEAPTRGTVELAGTDLLPLPPHKRPVNMMFQSYALFPHMSVEANVGYGLARAGVAKAEIGQRVHEVLEIVGLGAMAQRRPHQLSGGQRQRVALARAIVNRPKLLLLDEPLSALDKKVRAEMQLELKRLQHEVGITFVMVTHDQDEALSMADRVAVMSQGRVLQVASPRELYRRPANRFVAEFIGSSNVFTGAVQHDATTGVRDEHLGFLPGTPLQDRLEVGHLVVRPEDMVFTDGGDRTPYLQGTVVESQYFGGTSTIAVRVPDHPGLVLVEVPGTAPVERNSAVGITWDPALAVVVP